MNAAHHLEKLEDTNEAFFVGSRTLEPEMPRPVNSQVAFVEEPNCRSQDSAQSEICEVYKVGSSVQSRSDVVVNDDQFDGVSNLFFFETWFCQSVGKFNGKWDEACGTVDTGCQRLAVGAETFRKYGKHLPDPLQVTLQTELNGFKSAWNFNYSSGCHRTMQFG